MLPAPLIICKVDKNGRDGVDFFLDLSANPPLVELVLLNSPAFSPFNRDRSLDSGFECRQ